MFRKKIAAFGLCFAMAITSLPFGYTRDDILIYAWD